LDSFVDSSLETFVSSFGNQDVAYFGSSVETSQITISTRTLRWVCFQKDLSCFNANYTLQLSTSSKDPVFSVDFTSAENSDFFRQFTSSTTLLVKASILVQFETTKATQNSLPQNQVVELQTIITVGSQEPVFVSEFGSLRPCWAFLVVVLMFVYL